MCVHRRRSQGLVRRPFRRQRTDQPVACDAALGDDRSIDQDHGYPEVVKAMQLVVGVDVTKLGLDAKVLKQSQGLVAEVAPLPGHEDGHRDPGLSAQRCGGPCETGDVYAVGCVKAVRTSLVRPEP